jgi:hypothetical protein
MEASLYGVQPAVGSAVVVTTVVAGAAEVPGVPGAGLGVALHAWVARTPRATTTPSTARRTGMLFDIVRLL